jgi:hypothetical protein
MQKRLQEVRDHLREDIEKVDEPQLKGDVRDLGGSVGRPDQGVSRLRAEEREGVALRRRGGGDVAFT